MTKKTVMMGKKAAQKKADNVVDGKLKVPKINIVAKKRNLYRSDR